jgi:hypothetical protein
MPTTTIPDVRFRAVDGLRIRFSCPGVWAALGTLRAVALGGRIMNPAHAEAAAAAGAAV